MTVEKGSAVEGTFAGFALGQDGKPSMQRLKWRGEGFGLRRIEAVGHPTLYAQGPAAKLELFLPVGTWTLALLSHDWSGVASLRDEYTHQVIDLYAPASKATTREAIVVGAGDSQPVTLEIAPQRNPDTQGVEIWLMEIRQSPSVYYPESGVAVSSTCRLIQAKHGVFMALRSDIGVPEELAGSGLWEEPQVDLFKRLARPGETVFDVGANIGHHTVVLSQIVGDAGKVFAFEPQMQMFNVLNANLVLNRCRNAFPTRAAVGSEPGKLRMNHISYDHFAAFAMLGLQTPGDTNTMGESVDIVKLDDFAAQADLGDGPVSFIKVDVQAHELYVFQGAREFLRRWRPSISFEVSPYWMRGAGYDWKEILTLLAELGYSFYDELGRPLAVPEWDGVDRGEWQFTAVHPHYYDRIA